MTDNNLTCHETGEPCGCTGKPHPLRCPSCEEDRVFKAGTGRRVLGNDITDERRVSLTEDDSKRLEFPLFDGCIAYFPNALAEVSRVSKIGNDQHNPGEEMHWARDKSTDHQNKIARHLVDVGKLDDRGVSHTARLAWRALAMLQEEIERNEGLPPSRASVDRPW